MPFPLTVMASSKGNVIYTLASELISKWLKESFDEYESEIEVSDSTDSDICDERHNETIDFVAPNKLLHNTASPNPLSTC